MEDSDNGSGFGREEKEKNQLTYFQKLLLEQENNEKNEHKLPTISTGYFSKAISRDKHFLNMHSSKTGPDPTRYKPKPVDPHKPVVSFAKQSTSRQGKTSQRTDERLAQTQSQTLMKSTVTTSNKHFEMPPPQEPKRSNHALDFSKCQERGLIPPSNYHPMGMHVGSCNATIDTEKRQSEQPTLPVSRGGEGVSTIANTPKPSPILYKATSLNWIDFEKYTARRHCFEPATLTSNINYEPNFTAVDKRTYTNLPFQKMTGRAGSHAKLELNDKNKTQSGKFLSAR